MTSSAEIRIEAAQAIESQDYTTESVPLSERRDSITMGLLWITMVTGFPSVLIGFQWSNQGLTLPQVVACSLASCLLVLAYCVPSCYLGSKSGLTYPLLSRKVFGRWGSWLVSGNLAWISIAWYALTAVFLADGLRGLYAIPVPAVILSMVLAFFMAFNNFFGFSGVANFAKYLAGPILVGWVMLTFFKAGGSCPGSVWSAPGTVHPMTALTMVSSFVIGYSCWGNEADYWRYGKQNVWSIVIPLVVSLMVGEVLFPITGWMLGHMTHAPNYAAATRLMNDYAFGGVSAIAAIVLIVTYCASNDASLYGAINSIQNIRPMPRKRVVTAVTIVGTMLAAALTGFSKNFEAVASLSCVFLPSATVIILAEQFFAAGKGGASADLTHVPDYSELPTVRWSAVIALVIGCAFGTLTCGIIPSLQRWNVGVPSLQAWIVSLCVYLLLRGCEIMAENARKQR